MTVAMRDSRYSNKSVGLPLFVATADTFSLALRLSSGDAFLAILP